VDDLCESVTVLNRGRLVYTGSLDKMRVEAPQPVWRLATSDDLGALGVAEEMPEFALVKESGELRVDATQAELDDYVIRLGRAGIAVRRITQDRTPLESMFFQLTSAAEGEPD
jgi:ABC-2 type transport system ATP-binding protein